MSEYYGDVRFNVAKNVYQAQEWVYSGETELQYTEQALVGQLTPNKELVVFVIVLREMEGVVLIGHRHHVLLRL